MTNPVSESHRESINPASVRGKKIFITGSTGFLGRHLTNKLLDYGAEVHAISRWRADFGEECNSWQCDLTNFKLIRNILDDVRPDLIFHLAGHVTGARGISQVLPSFHNNLETTVNLLTAIAEIGCKRIILTGSMEEPIQGDEDAIPGSPYAAAKWAGNAYTRMFHALYGVPSVYLRVFMVYGPGQQDLDKLVPYVITSLLRDETPKLSSGYREIDWIYVEDVVAGMIAAALAPNAEGKTFDLGSGYLKSIRSIVECLRRIMNTKIEPQYGVLPDRPMEIMRVADPSQLHEKTGWAPTTTIEDGLSNTVEYFRKSNHNQQSDRDGV